MQVKTELPDTNEPDGPAVITAQHRQNRPATDKDMKPIIGKAAWRKLSPLESVFEKNQLAGGNPKYLAEDRFEAGKNYEQIWMVAQTAGTDSTQALNISRSHGGLPISQAQQTAIRSLIAIESQMGERDRLIVRSVCGLGHWPSEAVRTVCGDDYKFTCPGRFRESLDVLIEAMAAVSRRPGVVRMERS